MSTAKYSSGQKTVDCASAGADDVELEEGFCACSVHAATERPVSLWTKYLSFLKLFIVSLLPWLALAAAAAFAVSQVARG
jgi:hypothetical protein